MKLMLWFIGILVLVIFLKIPFPAVPSWVGLSVAFVSGLVITALAIRSSDRE